MFKIHVLLTLFLFIAKTRLSRTANLGVTVLAGECERNFYACLNEVKMLKDTHGIMNGIATQTLKKVVKG